MEKINKNSILLLAPVVLFLGFLTSSHTFAEMELSTEPLILKTAPTKPNVLLMLDDSGSMATRYGGDDSFYSPGFNYMKDYKCSADSTFIPPSANIQAKIYQGLDGDNLGVFVQGGREYALAQGVGVYTASGQESRYELSCQASSDDVRVAEKRCRRGRSYCSWSGWQDNNTYSLGDFGFSCDANSTQNDVISFSVPSGYAEDDCEAAIDGDGLSGCHWDASMDPNSDYYTNFSGTDRRFRVRDLEYSQTVTPIDVFEKDFATACFYDDLDYKVSLKADTCADEAVVMSYENTGVQVNKTLTTCSSGTATADYETLSGKYLNWYFSNSSGEFFDFTQITDTGTNRLLDDVGGLAINLDQPKTSFITTGNASNANFGYRENTRDNYERTTVMIDVAAIFVAGVSDMEVGIATYDASEGAGEIDREILELGSLIYNSNLDEDESTFQNNRILLLDQIRRTPATGGTPLKGTFTSMALYYAHGINESGNGETIFNGLNAYDLFRGDLGVGGNRGSSWETSSISGNNGAIDEPITEAQHCQQNVIFALTDGSPTGYGETPCEFIEGSESDSGSCDGGTPDLDDITRVLFQNDIRPDINEPGGNTAMNNIRSYMVGFGALFDVDSRSYSASTHNLLINAAASGGGAFYPATDGVSLSNAFSSFADDLGDVSLSVTQVAVSSVAELATENYAFQAGFNSLRWNGDITSFFLTQEGSFKEKEVVYGTSSQLPTIRDVVRQETGLPDITGLETSDTGLIKPLWKASDALNRMYITQGDVDNDEEFFFYRSLDQRQIFTINSSSNGGTAFTASNYNSLPTSIKGDISQGALRLDVSKEALIEYLRGDQSLEIGNPVEIALDANFNETTAKFRQRLLSTTDVVDGDQVITGVTDGSLLGDITNSSPVFVKEPPRPWVEGKYGGAVATADAYTAFQSAHRNRTGMLYVGANDGMLHAFTTEPKLVAGELFYDYGSELFAYIPSFIASSESNEGLHYLAEPSYNKNHKYLTNGTPTASDVYMNFYGGSGTLEWRSILVSGVAQGGKGLFALDITCPFEDSTQGSSNGATASNTCDDESFDVNNVLWEFTHERLGFTFSKPVIAKVDYTAQTGNGNGTGRWAAIVNNGYNSTAENAAVFVIFLDGPGADGWDEGTDYLILEASASGIASAATSSDNGLSSPQVVDLDNDGMIDRIYAGDLLGQLWAWDISEPNDSTGYRSGDNWTVNLLFSSQNNQAITTTPQLARDPAVRLDRGITNIMVMFGTGKLLEDADIVAGNPATETQTVYGVHDRDTFGLGVGDLQERRITQSSIGALNLRTITGNDYVPTSFGWYIDLPTNSERIIYDGFVDGPSFVFSTFIPDTTECAGGSTGWTMIFDWTTGLALPIPAFDADGVNGIDDNDLPYSGYQNTIASSQVSRAGGFLLGSSGNDVMSNEFDGGGFTINRRLSWDEKFPFGLLK